MHQISRIEYLFKLQICLYRNSICSCISACRECKCIIIQVVTNEELVSVTFANNSFPKASLGNISNLLNRGRSLWSITANSSHCRFMIFPLHILYSLTQDSFWNLKLFPWHRIYLLILYRWLAEIIAQQLWLLSQIL